MTIITLQKLTIQDLKGSKIKKDLQKYAINVNKLIKRYHNKHIDGSGNFGFTIRVNDIWLTMDGEYNSKGEITILEICKFDYGNRHILNINSYEDFIYDLANNIMRLIK